MSDSTEQKGFPPRLYGDNTAVEIDGKRGSMWFATPKRCAEADHEYLSMAEHTALLSEAVREARADLEIAMVALENSLCECEESLPVNDILTSRTCAKCDAILRIKENIRTRQ